MSLKSRQDLYSIVDHDQDVGYLAITCKEVTGNFKQCSGMFFFVNLFCYSNIVSIQSYVCCISFRCIL